MTKRGPRNLFVKRIRLGGLGFLMKNLVKSVRKEAEIDGAALIVFHTGF